MSFPFTFRPRRQSNIRITLICEHRCSHKISKHSVNVKVCFHLLAFGGSMSFSMLSIWWRMQSASLQSVINPSPRHSSMALSSRGRHFARASHASPSRVVRSGVSLLSAFNGIDASFLSVFMLNHVWLQKFTQFAIIASSSRLDFLSGRPRIFKQILQDCRRFPGSEKRLPESNREINRWKLWVFLDLSLPTIKH